MVDVMKLVSFVYKGVHCCIKDDSSLLCWNTDDFGQREALHMCLADFAICVKTFSIIGVGVCVLMSAGPAVSNTIIHFQHLFTHCKLQQRCYQFVLRCRMLRNIGRLCLDLVKITLLD